MRKAVLIYNPASGKRQQERRRQVEDAAAILRFRDTDAVAVPTTGPGTAGDQARQALEQGADAVFACGGDGTVHEVLQGLVGFPNATLGVIPLGTANALATDMGLPRDSAKAMRAAMHGEARSIAVGRMTFLDRQGNDAQRYFIVAAGIGADAHLMYRQNAALKRRYGMAAYYAQATWIWAMHPFLPFQCEFHDCVRDQLRCETVTEVLAVRISDFGGLLRRMAPRAALSRNDFELVLFKTKRRRDYLKFMLQTMAGRRPNLPEMEFVHSDWLECRPLTSSPDTRIHAEADGELLGRIPTRIEIVPNAVRLLMPVASRAEGAKSNG
jgi:YegS/Rv2252/BmrU family lipid kinase